MSKQCYAIEQSIVYSSEINTIPASSLFFDLIVPDDMLNNYGSGRFDIDQDMLDNVRDDLNDESIEEMVANGTWTAEQVKEAREQVEYYTQIIKSRDGEPILFDCF